jgi:uncharacterized protein
MDELSLPGLIIFVFGSFVAALVAALGGFAFGILAAAIWLHVLGPTETTALVVAFGLLVQGYSMVKLRRAIRPRRVLPFLLGALPGVPVGVELLRWLSPPHIRASVGVLLVIFSLYTWLRPKLAPIAAGGRLADAAVGLASGVIGGTTGLGGILPTVWCQLRGWPRDEQRAVFQPVAVAIFLLTAAWLGAVGEITPAVVRLFLLGLPAVLVGMWIGMRLYGRLDEAGFRKVVLTLLLVSGLALVA